MTAPAASDLARAVEALERAVGLATEREQAGLVGLVQTTAKTGRTILAALRSREQEAARWKAVADELERAVRIQHARTYYCEECGTSSGDHEPNCKIGAALARFDAAVKESQ